MEKLTVVWIALICSAMLLMIVNPVVYQKNIYKIVLNVSISDKVCIGIPAKGFLMGWTYLPQVFFDRTAVIVPQEVLLLR